MTIPSPEIYRGVELLRIPPNLIDGARRESLAVSDAGTAGVHGAVVRSWPDAPPTETRTLEWVCPTRDALASLEAFLVRRMGRRVAFWCPTFRQDAIGLGSDLNWIAIQASAYKDAFAGIGAARNGRDHWIAQSRNGSVIPRPIVSVSDVGGGVHRLNFDVSYFPLPDTTAAGTLYSRLELVRLADDTITTRYATGAVATVSISITTIPRETP